MSEELRTSDSRSMEDWHGSNADTAGTIVIRRVFNGVIVHPEHGQNSLVEHASTLVFQDTGKLFDWIEHWYQSTTNGAKR